MSQQIDSGSADIDPAAAAMTSLTGALVDANDQLLTLYALTDVSTDSLDGATSVEEILQQAKTMLAADVMRLDGPDGFSVATDGSSRSRELDDHDPSPTSSAQTTASIGVTNSSGCDATLTARRLDRPFGTADHKLLTAIANMALGALHTSRLHQEAVSQAVVARDHDTASELAVRALPRWQPAMLGANLFARSDPARSAGGDLYTYAEIGDTLHFVIGDVSGKGLPAAMMMTNVISASLAAFHGAGTVGPAAVLARIDEWTYEFLSDASLFVTLVVGAFDQSTGKLSLANAGHSPVLWCSSGKVEMIDASVPPVGVLPISMGPPPEEVVLATQPGDRLVVASDGFTEQANQLGTMFGDDRLIAEVANDTSPCHEFGERLYEILEIHADGAEQSDDRTVLILDINDIAAVES